MKILRDYILSMRKRTSILDEAIIHLPFNLSIVNEANSLYGSFLVENDGEGLTYGYSKGLGDKYSIAFNRQDSSVLRTIDEVDLGEEFTFSTWFKDSGSGGNGVFFSNSDIYNPKGGDVSIYLRKPETNPSNEDYFIYVIRVHVLNSDGSLDLAINNAYAYDGYVNPNTWNHVAVTINKSPDVNEHVINVYINGFKVPLLSENGLNTDTHHYNHIPTTLSISGHKFNENSYRSSTIPLQSCRIFDKILSENEILDLSKEY